MGKKESNAPVYIISFLGTGNYVKCCYVTEEWDSGPVTFIQTAVCKYWKDFQKRQIVLSVFCTPESGKKHWVKVSADGTSLPEELVANGVAEGSFAKVDVADSSFSEAGLWGIFNNLRTLDIPDGAEIVFDITHSFRSLPMVMAVLLNYWRVTKHVKLVGCHYGAFEDMRNIEGKKLNDRSEQEKVNPEDRKAPFVSLERMFELNEWTQAVHDFEALGNGRSLRKLAADCITTDKQLSRPCEVCSGGKKKTCASPEQVKANNVHALASAICNFSENVLDNRLGNPNGIQNTKFSDVLTLDASPTNRNGFMNALVPLLERLSQDLTCKLGLCTPGDVRGGALNGIRAAYWAYGHGLNPQALTLLQEAIISFFLASPAVEKIIASIHSSKKPRDFLESVLAWRSGSKDARKFICSCDEERTMAVAIAEEITEETTKSPASGRTFWQLYQEIISRRNDINHAGTKNGANAPLKLPNQFWSELLQIPCFQELAPLLET